MNQPELNVNDIINLLDEVRESSSYEVITSKKNKIKFLPMSAEDQKNLIKVMVDSPLYNSKFAVKIYDILGKTYVGEDKFIDLDLSILDRDIILIKCRAENSGDEYEIPLEKEDKKPKVSLNKHLQSLKFKELEDSNVVDGDISVVINYPTIKKDYELEKYLEKLIDVTMSKDNATASEIKGLISHLFIVNVIKYIKTVTIRDSVIAYDGLTTSDKLKITANLSSLLIQKITKEIDFKFSKPLKAIKTIKYGPKSDQKEHIISIDNSFFVTG